MKKRVAIIGFGRFGRLLAELMQADYDVAIVDNNADAQEAAKQMGLTPIPFALLTQADVIFLAVPIAALEGVLQQLQPIAHKDQTVIDICSVKVYPAKLMQRYLPDCQTLASHPLFGPDSAKHGLKGLKIVLCPLSIKKANLRTWQSFWKKYGVQVLEKTPEEHDKDMIYSLGFTHALARMIDHMNIPDLTLTTRNYEAIRQVAELSLNDTPQLYHDMLYYNPFFSQMKSQLKAAAAETLNSLDMIAEELEQITD